MTVRLHQCLETADFERLNKLRAELYRESIAIQFELFEGTYSNIDVSSTHWGEYYIIIECVTQADIGWIDTSNYPMHRRFNVIVGVKQAKRGKGHALSAVALIGKDYFMRGYEKMNVTVWDSNESSKKLAQFLDVEGVSKSCVFNGVKRVDRLNLGITRERAIEIMPKLQALLRDKNNG